MSPKLILSAVEEEEEEEEEDFVRFILFTSALRSIGITRRTAIQERTHMITPTQSAYVTLRCSAISGLNSLLITLPRRATLKLIPKASAT
jgi:hypothetical protein